MTDARQCKASSADGSPCRAAPLPGGEWCYFHDPQRAAQRAEGRRRGGANRARGAAVLPADTPDLPVATVGDVAVAVAATIRQVRRAQLDPQIGNCLGYLLSVQRRALESGELERRLAALEQRLFGGSGP
jgi:hypothetical protein